jgi:hypothetical protein
MLNSRLIKMSEVEMSEGVFTEKISGQTYEEFLKNQKGFKNHFVRFQPYNQVHKSEIILRS